MGGKKQLTTEDFIKKSKEKHGNRYLYKKTHYVNSKTKIIITCRIHGDFEQIPTSHYRGRGTYLRGKNNGADCYKCSLITRKRVKRKMTLINKYKNIVQPEDNKLIPLTKGAFAIVSNEDFEKVKTYNWMLGGSGYAVGAIKSIGYMHTFIKGKPEKKLEIDHIDKNKLNNQRSNLRFCSSTYNSQNTKRKSTSGFTGVHISGSKKHKWVCRIEKYNKVYHIGNFNCEIEAAKAYDEKAIELYGPNAHVNFPKKNNGA